jgi:hypothetical protein
VRLAALGALLLAVYAATLSIPATAGEDYAGDELHHLLAARSWVEDGDLDLVNQYADDQWREFTAREVRPSGTIVLGYLREPEGVGLPLAISPAYALGGAELVELAIAALTALAFVLAAALARRIVPEPWASAAVLVAGLSPPALAAATTVSPEPVAAALVAGAALCAVRVRERARLRHAYAGALLLALLPWLDATLAVTGLPVAVFLVRWTSQEGRRLVALITAELMLGSVVFYARLNETLFGGPLPSAAAAAPADDAAGIAERAPNLLGLWLDPSAGLLRWAPVLALAFAGAWLLARSRREHVAAAIPARREAERVAELLVATCAAQWLIAAFATEEVDGAWFPGLPLFAVVPLLAALAAWGLRRVRVAGAVLAVVTLALSAWVVGSALSGAPDGWLAAVR